MSVPPRGVGGNRLRNLIVKFLGPSMQKGLLTASLTHLGRFCLSCHHIDLGNHFPRRCLMHHVASTRNTAEYYDECPCADRQIVRSQ